MAEPRRNGAFRDRLSVLFGLRPGCLDLHQLLAR
jgi:hypothetical protein